MKQIKTSLDGKRLLLRKLRAGDAGDLYFHIKDKQITRWTMMILHPYPPEEAVKWIRKSQRLWRNRRACEFGIVLKKTQKVIGGIGLAQIDKQHKCAKLGFWLGKKYWSQGLTTEAARLVLNFGFRHLKLYRIYALAFEDNLASRKVLQKCGFMLEGIMRQAVVRYNKRHNLLNYGILISEYRNL